MRNLFLLLLFILNGFAYLNAQYLPPQREGISDKDYEKWTYRIQYWDKTMKEKELSNKGKVIFYANYSTAYYILKEPLDSVYSRLEAAMEVDKYEGCNFLDIANKNASSKLPKIEAQIGAKRWQALMKGCDVEIEKRRKILTEQRLAEFKANNHYYDFDLIERLKILSKKDQKHRLDAIRVEVVKGNESTEYQQIISKMKEQDSLNLIEVEKIINQYGYPGKTMVSSDFEEVILWVIHHSDSEEIRQKYLPILYEAAKSKELNIEAFKRFVDDVHIHKFGTQLYGTQSVYNSQTKSYEPSPIEQPERYEERFANLSTGVIDLGRFEF